MLFNFLPQAILYDLNLTLTVAKYTSSRVDKLRFEDKTKKNGIFLLKQY